MNNSARFTATGTTASEVISNAIEIAKAVGPEVNIKVVSLTPLVPSESNVVRGSSSARTIVTYWEQDYQATWETPEVGQQ